MKGKKRRLWEGVKTLLIVLLSCSAVYLATVTLFPIQLRDLFSSPARQPGQTSSAQNAYLPQTLRPAAFALTRSDGRYALLYHQEDQESQTHLLTLLAEALAAAQSPQEAGEAAWKAALAEPNLFCQYLEPIPLDAFSRWLSGADNEALTGWSATSLCITPNTLYLYDGPQNAVFSCALADDLSETLDSFSAQFPANGAHFAFEDRTYARLRPDCLILDTTPVLPQLVGANPITVNADGTPGEELNQILQALSFHPQTNSLYVTTGGWAINDGGDTLRVAQNGQLTFRQGEGDPSRYPVTGDGQDAARSLVEQTLGAFCGDGRLYLYETRHDGDVTTITYGYAYRGCAIHLNGESWCAKLTLEHDAITAFTLRPRRYTALPDALTTLLPQKQAAAALNGLGRRQWAILYEDAGANQPMVPFWAEKDR